MTKTKLRAADAAGRSTLTASRAGYGFREPAERSPVPERLFVNDDCGALDVSWLRRRRYRR